MIDNANKKQIPESFKQYLSGFFDGDACILVDKFKAGGYSLRVFMYQSNIEFIEQIQKYYPYLKSHGGYRRENNRCEYVLYASGKQIEPLIDDLCKYSILKYEQLCEAKKFFQYIGVQNTNAEKEAIYQRLKVLKKASTNKPYDRLNHIYIAGLFDAEGCITLGENGGFRIKLTQKSDVEILKKIAEMYNNTNKISNYAVCFYSFASSIEFLNSIKDYCIYKSPQIKLALDYLCSDKNNQLTNDISNKLKDEKKIDGTAQPRAAAF
jgi:hypothetical protein